MKATITNKVTISKETGRQKFFKKHRKAVRMISYTVSKCMFSSRHKCKLMKVSQMIASQVFLIFVAKCFVVLSVFMPPTVGFLPLRFYLLSNSINMIVVVVLRTILRSCNSFSINKNRVTGSDDADRRLKVKIKIEKSLSTLIICEQPNDISFKQF